MLTSTQGELRRLAPFFIFRGGFFWILLFMYDIQHCFICRPSVFTVSEDAGIEPMTVATTALAVRRSITTRLDLIHFYIFYFFHHFLALISAPAILENLD